MAGFKNWAEKSSIHGVANAAFSPKPIGKIFWLILLAGAIGASLYLSREVLIGYINGKTGTSVNVVAMTDREELERIVHLAYCPTDFVDRNKAARMTKTVLQYGLLLIPDLHWTVVEYVYKSLQFTDEEKMIIAMNDSPEDPILRAGAGAEKEPAMKWKIGGFASQGNDWSNSSPEGFRKAAEEFKSFMEEEGMTTLDEFLVSIAHDMVYPPRVPYRTTKMLAQYPRYGTLCYEVATQLDLELYAEHSKKYNVPMKTHMMYFDFLHTVPKAMPIEEDVPVDGISQRWNHEPGRLFAHYNVSFVNIDDDYSEPRIFLSFATGNHGLNNDYVLSIDQSNGVQPYEYNSEGGPVLPGYGVTSKVVGKRRREEPQYPRPSYILSGEAYFELSAIKQKHISNCEQDDLNFHTGSEVRITNCERQRILCVNRQYATDPALICGGTCHTIHSVNRTLSKELPPCNYVEWMRVHDCFVEKEVQIVGVDTAACDRICSVRELSCSSYTFKAEAHSDMDQRYRNRPPHKDLMWQFLLYPDVAMGYSHIMDLPQLYQDRYVLRVTLQLTNVWNIEEYYLVGAETLVGGIGGIFGLFMGLSIISLVEMITSISGSVLEKMKHHP